MNNLSLIQITDKIISCEENKRKLIFNCSSRQFCKIHVDNASNNKEKRCDYIIVPSKDKKADFNEIALWIELKGKDIEYALKQITVSIDLLGKNISKKYGAIVCSEYPKTDTRFQIAIRKLGLKKLFIKEALLNLKYNPNDNTISKT